MLQVPRLYPIIDRETLDERGIGVGEFAAELAAAGVRMVQYRDKVGGPQVVLRGAAEVSEAFAGRDCVLVMNDRADLAVLAGWRAVHVGQGDLGVEDVRRVLNIDLPVVEWGREEGMDEEGIRDRIDRASDSMMAAKAANLGPDLMRFVEKSLLIQVMDQVWKEHLLALDHLRQGIGLRAYGQKDPLNEYKSEAFALFNGLLDELKERVTTMLSRVEIGPEAPPAMTLTPTPIQMVESHPAPEMAMADAYGEPEMQAAAQPAPTMSMRSEAVDADDPATWRNTPRNAACPCGSGKKFKHCHGKIA